MQFKTRRRALRNLLLPTFACAAGLCAQHVICAQTPSQTAPLVPLTLSQAINLALKQNRTIQLAHLAVVDSEHKKEIVRSAYLPHIKNESTLLHVTELAGVEIPAGAFGVPTATGAIPAKNIFIGQGSATAYTSGTGLTQPLTQIFKIHESNRAAAADVDIAKANVSQAENEIALKVRQLYYGILIGQLKLQAANAKVASGQIRKQESEDAVAQGRALDVAALESRAALLESRQAVLTQQLQIRDLTLALDDLIGLPLNSLPQLDDSASAAVFSIPSREECLRIAQEQSPEIQTARQAVVKAKAGLAAAKDQYIPDVTGIARYSYQSGVRFSCITLGPSASPSAMTSSTADAATRKLKSRAHCSLRQSLVSPGPLTN